MRGLNRAGAALWRGAARLMPAARRDWAQAVWAEAPEVPPGLRRLAWLAGGARLMAREALMRRGILGTLMFAVAATAVAWAAWPSSSASYATSVDRAEVIVMVALLAGLPLLARPFLGPVSDSRTAWFLRAGTWAVFLVLIPALTVAQQLRGISPRGAAERRVYRLVSWVHPPSWGREVMMLVVMAVFIAAIVWLTSRRSGVTPATLAAGTGAGLVLGLVMYAVDPLGLSKAATNPWLPGSDVDPLVLLAWLLVPAAPVAAAVAAGRRCRASAGSPSPAGGGVRQMVAAGLLASLVGALFATAAGTGTIALMIREAWLRNWLYHGQRLLYGVQNLSADLRSPATIAYSHQITGAVDSGQLYSVCLLFPVIALLVSAMVAATAIEPPSVADLADAALG